MFKDLKEYQDITRIYNESVNISEEQRAINKIFIEEGFTSEEIEWLEENFDELWENELAQYTQECIVESFEGQNLTEEQVQQLDEVLGLKMLAKGITKAAPAVSKGLRSANIGIKKGIKAVGKKVSGGAKAIGTGIKDTARGAVSVGKSALKKVGGAIKKAAPIIGKGALLATGAALPVAAVGGIVKGVNALRKRGKAKREAGKAAADAALDAKIKAGIEKAGMGVDKGTAMTMQGIKDASYNRGLKAAQDKAKAEKNAQKAGEAGAQALKDKTKKKSLLSTPMKDTTELGSKVRQVKPGSARDKMIAKNEARHGKDSITNKRNMNADFQAMKKGKITKADFIDKYPKSITAQRSKGLRDHTEWDAYDMVLEYLFSTEQVTSLEEANYVMMEMDQQTIGEIVTEVKQELHELLPLAGLALGINALRNKGKSKRMGKAAGGAAGKFAPAGTAAGKGGSMVASVPKKPGGAAGKAVSGAMAGAAGRAAGSIGGGAGGAAGRAAGSMGGSKGTRAAGKAAAAPAKKSKIDLSGKSKAQIMALKRLGKI